MAFSYYRSLTIDHTKCGSANSANFPVLVSVSDATFKSVANSGHVQSATGDDILFFSDNGAVTQLASEVDSYDPATGIGTFWVKLGSVSFTVDTMFYVFYGNGAPPARTTGPWDTDFVVVAHLAGLTDSSSYANTVSAINTVTSTAGQVDGGKSVGNPNSGNAVKVANSASINVVGNVTMETWAFMSQQGSYQCLISRNTSGRRYSLFLSPGVTNGMFLVPGPGATTISQSWNQAAWNHFVVTADGANVKAYVNGVLALTSPTATGATTGTDDLYFGAETGSGFPLYGSLDETRISKVARSADWILTEYNNMKNPGNIGSANFLTWGSETPLASGSVNQILTLLGCGC